MYTRLTFWAEIPDDDAHRVAIDAINAMMNDAPAAWTDMPDHPFFAKDHAWGVLRCSSYYHNTGLTTWRHDSNANAYFLNVDASLKNYDDEIRSFLDWIHPYDFIHGGPELAGFYLYEEDTHPTLIYKDEVVDSYTFRQIGSS